MSTIFSRIIGNNFPLSIYLNQTIKIQKSFELKEVMEGTVEVVKDLGNNKYELRTICKNTTGEEIVTGRAIILQ